MIVCFRCPDNGLIQKVAGEVTQFESELLFIDFFHYCDDKFIAYVYPKGEKGQAKKYVLNYDVADTIRNIDEYHHNDYTLQCVKAICETLGTEY